jgi:tRNA(fMet)-specific endonuclease VapC
LRGWLAEIHRQRKPRNQTRAYQRFFDVLVAFENWDVFPWDEPCVEIFEDLVTKRLGVKTMDLKIASIALRNGATLLSRNLKDFERVPGLNAEDWLSSPTEPGE